MKNELPIFEGSFVRLEPLSLAEHFDDLCARGLDAELWRWTTASIKTKDDLKKYFETALDKQQSGLSIPFAIVEKQFRRAVGSTRFGNIDLTNKRVEIGWTWIGKDWQQTFVNTETKLLMLKHAFEIWKCQRVELKTDVLNTRSRAAIIRLGATEEGILRKHLITQAGRTRDTVQFSILDDEWPRVKTNLETKLKLINK